MEWLTRDAHHIDALGQTRQPQILMLANQHVQPSHESQHVSQVVRLLQPVLGIGLFVVPYVPLTVSQKRQTPQHTSSKAILTLFAGMPKPARWMLAESIIDLQISMLRSAASDVSWVMAFVTCHWHGVHQG